MKVNQFKQPSEEDYEKLRLILEKEQGLHVTMQDAKEVGDGLIGLYEVLARNRRITGVGKKSVKGRKN